MFYQEFLPSPALQPFIRLYGVLEVDPRVVASPVIDSAPPSLLKGLMFFYQYEVESPLTIGIGDELIDLPLGYFTPYSTRVQTWHYQTAFGLFAVLFQPGQFRRFFPFSTFEFIDKPIAVEEVNDPTLKQLHEQIVLAPTHQMRADAADQYFLRALGKAKLHLDLTDVAISQLFAGPEQKVHAYHPQLGVSERNLRRVFRREMGVGLKQYQKRVRFEFSMMTIKHKSFRTLWDIADRFGYYDASEFIKQFKEFTGATPKQFIQQRYPLSELLYFREEVIDQWSETR